MTAGVVNYLCLAVIGDRRTTGVLVIIIYYCIIIITDLPDSSDDGHEMDRESPTPLDSVDDVEQREPVRRDDEEDVNNVDCDEVKTI